MGRLPSDRSDDLNLVRLYIELDEQLKFRCSAPSSLVHLKHLDDEDEENGAAKQADSADGEAEEDQPATPRKKTRPSPSQRPESKRPRRRPPRRARRPSAPAPSNTESA